MTAVFGAWTIAAISLGAFSSVQAAQLSVNIQNLTTGQGLEDAVIEVLLPETQWAQYTTQMDSSVDQLDKEFVANVTVVPRGSRINFPNSDNILHHVYSFSQAKVFELPLYGKGEYGDYFIEFDQPGVVELGCNIHDWMLAYIYIAQTSLVAKTDDEGRAIISGIPEGVHTVRIWHARSPEPNSVVEQDVEFSDEEAAIVRLAVEPTKSNRLRRAPISNRTRYR
ncbi:MAG: methylamine utilization protein [Pseudohongiellaceae bacterium]|nr:methylamine utilization protein [Pseudohongiellaceae bacterium]